MSYELRVALVQGQAVSPVVFPEGEPMVMAYLETLCDLLLEYTERVVNRLTYNLKSLKTCTMSDRKESK